ncbi:hypothetical protein Hanom_Chr10g00936851 [Helianthus anomalus]
MEILEVKYQTTNKTSLTDQHLQHTQMSKVEKLRQHVKRYWVIAETRSPQFVMTSNPLSTATSGVICVIALGLNLLLVLEVPFRDPRIYKSAYKWSILFIVITQFIGVLVGTIAPIFRCFSTLNFKLGTKWNITYLMVFKVEEYWTQSLREWKQSPMHFLASSSRSRTLVYNSKSIMISHCISLQKATITLCKVITLVTRITPIVFVYCLYCWKSLKASLLTPPIAKHKCKWLDKALQKEAFRGKIVTEILECLSNRAKEIVREIKGGIRGEMVENPPKELIAANSMYRIAETILLRDKSSIEPITKSKLFTLLSGMIADILCACFTNIPRVITVKCHESVIENRKASVHAAAKLLGKTTKIIERRRELPI